MKKWNKPDARNTNPFKTHLRHNNIQTLVHQENDSHRMMYRTEYGDSGRIEVVNEWTSQYMPRFCNECVNECEKWREKSMRSLRQHRQLVNEQVASQVSDAIDTDAKKQQHYRRSWRHRIQPETNEWRAFVTKVRSQVMRPSWSQQQQTTTIHI